MSDPRGPQHPHDLQREEDVVYERTVEHRRALAPAGMTAAFVIILVLLLLVVIF